MSFEKRLENILETAKEFNTLVDLPKHYVDQVAKGGATPERYSNHQRKAAKVVAKKFDCSEIIALEWCAISRPNLFKANDNSLQKYENWRSQHNKSVADLAKDWAEEIERDYSKIEKVYSHVVFV